MSSLSKSTRKQKGGVSFDPQLFLATVGVARTITQCPKDYKIFSQSDPAESVFYIQQGRVKLKVKSKQDKEAVIAILGAGDFLGEACLIGQTVCLATATAIAPKERDAACPPRGAYVFRPFHTVRAFTQRARPGGFGRSTFQLQRATAGPHSFVARQLR